MLTTIEYASKEERDFILEQHEDKYLIAEKNINEGNFLVFTDVKRIEISITELNQDINDVAELTTRTAMDKDDIAEMLVYALQRIDELEERIDG